MEMEGGLFALSLKSLIDVNVHMKWKPKHKSIEVSKWVFESKAGKETFDIIL